MSAGDFGVVMIHPRTRSLVCACLYKPLDSFRPSPRPLDLGVTMLNALRSVIAYLLYWVGDDRPRSRRQTTMQSMISCSLHPAQTKKNAMLASYSLGLFRPSRNGHGLVARSACQVD